MEQEAHFGLSAEAVEFFAAGRQFIYDPTHCEPGLVRLKSLPQLCLEKIWLYPESEEDPNSGNEGHYSIPAVSLTGECGDYIPNFILLWLPNEKLFGTWDNDHAELTVFPGAKWKDIEDNPAPYLDAQWNPVAVPFATIKPWQSYPLSPGRPY